jgi:uncharacterized membrane protein YeaQ/YmgE (transglycosylase-associated protein family)
MSLLAWIILGLIAGFIANKIVSGAGRGVVMDIVLGIVGAVVGGWLFNAFGMEGVAGFNLYSLVVAVIGASLLLVVYHAVSRRA